MTDEQIKRFFQKQCGPKEASQVEKYLKADPALLEKYLSEHEWNSAKAGESMPEEFWNEIWLNIRRKRKARIIHLWLKRSAVAASIVVLTGTGYYLFTPQKNIRPQITGTNVLTDIQPHTVRNNTNKTMGIVLQDSSVVKLSPASIIKYDIPFQNNKREIWLDGEAYFQVTKDKTKPFTVYAGALATTALGTAFTIKTNGKQNIINVKLFTGKVVITAADKNLKGWNKDVYLQPGEQIRFNSDNMLLAIEKIANTSSDKNVTAAPVRKPAPVIAGDELSFSNTLLPDVMNKLSEYYHIKIEYDKALLDTMHFTGTLSKKDSVQVILKVIAQMNDLEIVQSENEFIVTKHQ